MSYLITVNIASRDEVSNSLSTTWNILSGSVNNELALSWEISLDLTNSFTTSWVVLDGITNTVSPTWEITDSVLNYFIPTWVIQEPTEVQNTLETKWIIFDGVAYAYPALCQDIKTRIAPTNKIDVSYSCSGILRSLNKENVTFYNAVVHHEFIDSDDRDSIFYHYDASKDSSFVLFYDADSIYYKMAYVSKPKLQRNGSAWGVTSNMVGVKIGSSLNQVTYGGNPVTLDGEPITYAT